MTRDISPIESIYSTILYWLQQEMKQDGILSDVQMIITSSERYDNLDTPLIWIEKGEITTTPVTHSNKISLDVPVSLICCDEVIDTIVEAEENSYNLASRCMTAFHLNMIQPRPMANHIHLRGFHLERLYPNASPRGSFQIESKSMMMAACRLDVVFTFEVDWILYEQVVDGNHSFVDYSSYDTGDEYDVVVDDVEVSIVPRPRPPLAYAPLDHNHDTRYSQLGHLHDDVYSRTNHNHDLRFSLLSHNHDTRYSQLGHTHVEYATRAEVASLASERHEHKNVLYISPFMVRDADLTYVLCEIEPVEVMILEDLSFEHFTVEDQRGKYIFLSYDETVDPERTYHLLYYTVHTDGVQQDTFLNVNDVLANVGDTVNLYSTVTDGNNAPVDEGTVDYSINDGSDAP